MPLVHANEVVQDGLHFAHRGVARRPARLGHDAITVAAADDIADAVFVAVDGKGVAGGQRAALDAKFGQLGLVEDHARGPAGAELSAEREPSRAVAVVEGVVAIDEAVPEFIEGLGELPRQQCGPRAVSLGMGFHDGAPW